MDKDSGELFISYKSERRRAAEHLAETLRRHGYSVWFDYQLVKGRDFGYQIDRRIRGAKALIVLWCTMSVRSEWVREEVDLAKHLDILVPTKIEACDLPVGHRLKDYINLSEWDGSPRSHQLDALFDAIAQKVGREPQANYRALQEYEATWRRFGAPSLKAFALEASLESSVGARPLPEPAERMRTEWRIMVAAKIVHGAPDGWLKPGAGNSEWFKDHEYGPEMVVVPAGEFMMGSPADEPERENWQTGTESPLHKVTISRPFAVGRFAISRGQFAAFVKAKNYNMGPGAHVWNGEAWTWDTKASWREPGFPQDDSHPVMCVSWEDATAYAAWLAELTNKSYRLLSEAEWEYVARAGTSGPFWWGSSISTSQANYNGNQTYGGGAVGAYRAGTVPVSSFAPNPWGLYNVHGNSWEDCNDVWHDNYVDAPHDGSPWIREGDPTRRVTRGGSWDIGPVALRSAFRNGVRADNRGNDRGFRLARSVAGRTAAEQK